jgi:hypothetical protein
MKTKYEIEKIHEVIRFVEDYQHGKDEVKSIPDTINDAIGIMKAAIKELKKIEKHEEHPNIPEKTTDKEMLEISTIEPTTPQEGIKEDED